MGRSTRTLTARLEWVSNTEHVGEYNCILTRCHRYTCVCFFGFTATCEMCGMVGVRDAFYSKTKRFCSVSCSRSYSSNSKKASILARLQVRAWSVLPQKHQIKLKIALILISVLYFCKGKPPTKKAKVLQKQPLMAKLAAYAQYQASQQNQPKSKAGMLPKSSKQCCSVEIYSSFTLCLVVRQWSLQRASTGVGISVAITRPELQSAVSST